MAQPILTLTTDFGLSDHYVGVMKGVILSICPRARIVDITHDVRPFAITEGAYAIAQAYRYFPKGTVHVVVVDPGVGTERRPILMEAAGQRFVAPDNGVLAMIYGREKAKVRLISNRRYFLKPVSQTFHGRDVFSPVAAHLAAGMAAAKMGEALTDYVRPDFEKPRRSGEGRWSGRVLKIDRFGNVVTNFQASDFPALERKPFTLAIGKSKVNVMAPHYAACAPGKLFAIIGSGGYIEISVGQSSAAGKMGCQAGESVELRLA